MAAIPSEAAGMSEGHPLSDARESDEEFDQKEMEAANELMERHLASRGHPQPPPKKQHQEPAKAVRTSHWYLTDPKLPERFDSPGTWNYKINKQHPLFTTTSNQYGSYYPSIHEMPLKFHGQSSRFTEHLSRAGPYRNFSLNTK